MDKNSKCAKIAQVQKEDFRMAKQISKYITLVYYQQLARRQSHLKLFTLESGQHRLQNSTQHKGYTINQSIVENDPIFLIDINLKLQTSVRKTG